MARKPEKPESTVEPKEPVSTTEASGSQPEDGALPLSPGEPSAPAADPGPGESAEQTLSEAPADLGIGSDNIAASDLVASAEGPSPETSVSDESGQNGQDLSEDADEISVSAGEDQVAANPNPATLQIYPMRSYMDEGELRRRGGQVYSVPRRHAEDLVRRKLASFEPLKE